MCSFTKCTHLSLFASFMIPSSPLFNCTTTGSKYSCFYACVHSLYVHILSPFTPSITHSSSLSSQQQPVSFILFFYMCLFTLCMHLCPFTSSVTLSPIPALKQQVSTLVYAHVHPLNVHICLSLHPPLHFRHHYLHNNRK